MYNNFVLEKGDYNGRQEIYKNGIGQPFSQGIDIKKPQMVAGNSQFN
jgi:hypothetical protein